MPDTLPEEQNLTRSQKLFLQSPEEIQKLLRDILKEEREVMHMLKRPEIHQKIVNLVRRHIA
jgi:hypothetical protein